MDISPTNLVISLILGFIVYVLLPAVLISHLVRAIARRLKQQRTEPKDRS